MDQTTVECGNYTIFEHADQHQNCFSPYLFVCLVGGGGRERERERERQTDRESA